MSINELLRYRFTKIQEKQYKKLGTDLIKIKT